MLFCVHNQIEYYNIPGYKNYYLSECGKCIRFIKSPTALKKILVPDEGKRIYILNEDVCYIHTILAKTFLKNYYEGCTVNFIDGNTLHYRLQNLQIV